MSPQSGHLGLSVSLTTDFHSQRDGGCIGGLRSPFHSLDHVLQEQEEGGLCSP